MFSLTRIHMLATHIHLRLGQHGFHVHACCVFASTFSSLILGTGGFVCFHCTGVFFCLPLSSSNSLVSHLVHSRFFRSHLMHLVRHLVVSLPGRHVLVVHMVCVVHGEERDSYSVLDYVGCVALGVGVLLLGFERGVRDDHVSFKFCDLVLKFFDLIDLLLAGWF